MEYENIIVGCGPAGLQCAYYFKKLGINYVIIERNAMCGSFFHAYPHSGKLISVNKKYTGSDNADFNLRHDWNSLLNDEQLLFTDYTDKYYPSKKIMVKYLNDFATKNELNIHFNKNVTEIIKREKGYFIKTIDKKENTTSEYSCKKLIIATGMSLPNIPDFIVDVKDKIKHYAEYKPNYFLKKKNIDQFRNKNVLLIGSGNAAFELANVLNGVASSVLVAGRSKKDWAMSSHYSGDLRSVYMPFMDTFLLKSLNGIDYFTNSNNSVMCIYQNSSGGQYLLKYLNMEQNIYNKSFDTIIYCTGWKFDSSIFRFQIDMIERIPDINVRYESKNNKNLFFIGSLMQKFDYKVGSGAFIHGFRYLIKTFVRINYNMNYKCELIKFKSNEDLFILANYIVDRINTSSDMYQMFAFISDIIFYQPERGEVIYYKNVPIMHAPMLLDEVMQTFKTKDFITYSVSLEFGTEKVEKYKELDNGAIGLCVGNENRSKLIHPVVRIVNPFKNEVIEVYHFCEDLFAEFKDKAVYLDRLMRIFRPII